MTQLHAEQVLASMTFAENSPSSRDECPVQSALMTWDSGPMTSRVNTS